MITLNSKFSFSVEKGFRFFEDEVSFFHFFMIQFQIPKKHLPDNSYVFKLTDSNNKVLFSKEITIDRKNKRIITPNSHEDPLVEDQNDYFICFQIDSEKISNLNTTSNASFYQKENMILLAEHEVGILSEIYKKYTGENYSKIIEKTKLATNKDCILTLHLGDKHGKYSEQSFLLTKDQIFNFDKYINEYSYIGVQCSYEHENPEIEEKHIIVGQKGIYLSGYFYNNNLKIMPPLCLNQEYQQHYDKNEFILISSINELIEYYKQNKSKPKYFESNLYFLLPGYTKYNTYNQDKLYSNIPLTKKIHFNLNVCKNCEKNSKCVQIVPSGLSSSLFKENILIENPIDCRIYKLIKS